MLELEKFESNCQYIQIDRIKFMLSHMQEFNQTCLQRGDEIFYNNPNDQKFNGMGITTKEDLKEGQRFNCEVYIDDRTINIVGEVAWRKMENSKYEYGIKSEYPDYVVKNTVRLYLELLKKQQEDIVESESKFISIR